MRHFLHKPPPPLASLVRCFWYSEGFAGNHSQERLLPNGESTIVFDLRDGPMRIYEAENPARFQSIQSAVFCGPRADSFVIDTCQQERVLGVQFCPGGSFPFLRMPVREVASGTYSLEYLWPGEAAPIREQLLAVVAPASEGPGASAAQVVRLFSILEDTLLRRLVRPPELHPAVGFAARRLGATERVAEVVERVGLSPRRFIELFERQIGLTPKVFQRVRRFQRVLASLHGGAAERDLAGVALDCGYYDQPHFIHDFREFSGLTPVEYLAAATPHLNHVPLN